MSRLTLGSLFDGSGGFPLGGLLCGIEPLWASEVEPFPIRVTTKRIPRMMHYGDISKLNGADLPPVDIITFGSPCTDMSVAGKRAGLDGEQSVLFYEAIRIIKEMRCKSNGRYPRYAVWENVPGTFSSNKGADFQAVLEAVIGVIEPTAEVPAPDNGRWPYADCYMQASDVPEPDEDIGLVIEMPRSSFTDTALDNLKRLVKSKSNLIKKALGTETLELEITDDKVGFPWFGDGTDPDTVKAYTHFVTALCEMARVQKRVTAKEKEMDNDKYAFRCFLLRLGFIGAAYKEKRKILLRNLTDSSAFKTPKSECNQYLESEAQDEQ